MTNIFSRRAIFFIILLIVLIVVFITFFIFYKISKVSQKIAENEIKEFTGPKIIFNKEIFTPEFIDDNQIIFYDLANSSINSLNLNNNEETLLVNNVIQPSSPDDIKWSQDKKRVIITQSESLVGAKNVFYEINNKKEIVLDFSWLNPFWTQDSLKIAYFYYQEITKSNALYLVDYNNKDNFQRIDDLPEDYYKAAWLPLSKELLLLPVSSGDAPIGIMLKSVNLEKKEITNISLDKEIIDMKSSPREDIVVLQFLKDYTTTNLGIYNLNTKEFVDLNLASILSKVNWSKDGQYIFFAVSHNGIEEKNDIYVINTKTKEKRFIPLYLRGNFKITNILFSEKNPKNLYFISRDRLYKIELKQPISF